MQQVKQPLTIALRKQGDKGTTQISLGFFLLIFSLSFFSFTPVKSESQQQSPQTTIQNSQVDAWIFDKLVGNVEFYHMITECNGKQAVFLKFNNRNSYKVKISWKEVLKEKGSEEKIESLKGAKQVILAQGIISVIDCNDLRKQEFVITHDQVTMTHSVSIVQFEFKDVHVIRIN